MRPVALGLGTMLLPAVLAGCYAYTPLETLAPSPAGEVSLVLSDQGRADAASTFGSGIDRVEGRVVSATDTAYLLEVSRVRTIRGAESEWSHETVMVPRAWVGNAYERRFSRSRTYLLAGAFTVAVSAFIATRTLGIGGPTLQNPGGGGGGSQQ